MVRDSALSSSVSLRWDQVAPWVEGASVHVSRDVVLRWPNEAFARIWSERLRRWRDATPEARAEDFSQFAKESLNTEKAATEVQHLSRHLRTLRWMASLIFVWCFGVITVLYTVLGEVIPVLIVAAMLIPLLWIQSLLYWRTTKVPELRGRYRFWQCIAIAFLPQMAMRAADYAMKDQLFCPHPLAARALIGEVRWTKLCRETWKAIQYTGTSDRPSKLEHALLSEFFAQQKVEAKDLEECPARQPGSEAYCPSCLSQFTSKDVLCKDCGGVAVKTWS